MVGDHAQRDILLRIVVIVDAGDADHMLHDVLHSVHFKEVVHALHNARQPLEAHAGVDVAAFEPGVIAIAVAFKLGEHQVPEFRVAVAVAARAAGRRAAAVFFAAVKIDFRARTARTCAVLPEVVLLAQPDDVRRIHADFFRPDVKRLVVVLIDRDPELFNGHFHHFRAKLPCPRARLVFEIIAERKVAQHLKIGAVARRDTHALDIGRADAFLAGRHAAARRRQLAGKILFQRRHAGVDEQQAFVVLRHQRKARQPQMPFAFKEFQILFADLVESHPFHCVCLPFKKNKALPHAGVSKAHGTTRLVQKAPLFPVNAGDTSRLSAAAPKGQQSSPLTRARLQPGRTLSVGRIRLDSLSKPLKI